MRLVTCPACRTHLDVSDAEAGAVVCPCGTSVDAVVLEGRQTTVRRCGGCGASLAEDAPACGYCQSPIVRERQRLTLVCPDCLARNPESGRYCTGCGTEFLPQAPRASGAPKACPACEGSLVPHRVRDVWLLACSSCDGLWVPAAGFDALVRRASAPAPGAAAGLGTRRAPAAPSFDARVVYRRCPECGERMVRKNFGASSGVIVDWCGAHGTWLDPDELARVGAFVAGGGLERGPRAPDGSDEVRIVLERAERTGTPRWAVWLEKLVMSGR